jgi:uncharacterized protein (TIGR02996 family)
MSLILKVAVQGQDAHLFRFGSSEVSLGRLQGNDILLAHDSVADHHARIVTRDGRHILVDMKTEHGTFVNGRRMTAPIIVCEGDVIRVGAYEVGLLEREPPGETERAFLEALSQNPNDDDSRSVYSDWLDEQSRRDEADFLRTQLALKGIGPANPSFRDLSSVLTALAPLVSPSWRRLVARPPIEKCPVRFELICPKRWDALKPTGSLTERFCDACKKNVHFAPTVAAARRLALTGHCVAIDVAQARSEDDLDPPVRMVGMIAPPS